MNPFNVLEISPAPSLKEGQVAERFTELSREHHPDVGGDRQQFESLTAAQRMLATPSRCLKSFLELTYPETFSPKGPVSEELMDLFSRVGQVLQETSELVHKKKKATSPLAQATLLGAEMEAQEALDALGSEVEAFSQEINEELASSGETIALDEGERCFRALSYLEKWKKQIQDLRLQLLF